MDRDSPRYVERLERHSRRIGSGLQTAVRKLVLVYLCGLPLLVFTHLFFRVRLVDGARYDALGPRAILALRHFHEWDPMLTYFCFGLRRAFRAGHPPLTIASDLWARTAPRRAFSWLIGVLPLIPNHEPDGALARALDLLAEEKPRRIAICPTGPIGLAKRYRVGYSVGYLAVQRPDIPIVPVTIVGVQGLRWSRVLTLRRPRITVAIAPPIYGSELGEGSSTARQKVMCDRVDQAWQALEARLHGAE